MSRPSELSLRPEQSSDRELLLQVYASTRERELSLLPWSEADKHAFVRSQFEAQYLHYHRHYADAEYSIILARDRPAGRLYVDRGPDEVRVIDITLLPEYRGSGIGSALLLQLKQEAHAAGKPLTIHVEHDNPASRLYRRLGFARVSDDGVYQLMVSAPSSQELSINGE